jgi:hypothetical protein
MTPSCETVEYASIFLISYWRRAASAATTEVIIPVTTTTSNATGVNKNITRANKNTPAATIVAA